MSYSDPDDDLVKVALVTGSARRVGRAIAEALHAAGYNLIVHYHTSKAEAEALAARCEANRMGSCALVQADLTDPAALAGFAEQALAEYNRLDLLVNNASQFYPTPLGEIDSATFDELIASNLKAPLLLSQACAPALSKARGSIVNISDIHAQNPAPGHLVYNVAKAGLEMLTKSLALELAPAVRVNSVAPGALLWPEGPDGTLKEQPAKLANIPLQRLGGAAPVAEAVLYLAQADYVTGATLTVDGGRSRAQF